MKLWMVVGAVAVGLLWYNGIETTKKAPEKKLVYSPGELDLINVNYGTTALASIDECRNRTSEMVYAALKNGGDHSVVISTGNMYAVVIRPKTGDPFTMTCENGVLRTSRVN